MEFPTKILEGLEGGNPMNYLAQKLDDLAKSSLYPVCSSYKKSIFPDMENAVEIAQDKIYRVNTPGYFYRYAKKSSAFNGKSGLVISDTFNGLIHYHSESVKCFGTLKTLDGEVVCESDYNPCYGMKGYISASLKYNDLGNLTGDSLNSFGTTGVVYQWIKDFDFATGARPAFTSVATSSGKDTSTEDNPGFLYLFNKYLGFDYDDSRYQGIYWYSDTIDPTDGGKTECSTCCGFTCEPYTMGGPYTSYCFNSPTTRIGVTVAPVDRNVNKCTYFISTGYGGSGNDSGNNMIPIIPGESTHCDKCHLVHEKSSAVVGISDNYPKYSTTTGRGYITDDSIGSFFYWYRDKDEDDDEVRYFFIPVKGLTTFDQGGKTLKTNPITCVGMLNTIDSNNSSNQKIAKPIRITYDKLTSTSSDMTGYGLITAVKKSGDSYERINSSVYSYRSAMNVGSVTFSGSTPFELYGSSGSKLSGYTKTAFKNGSLNFDPDTEDIIGLNTVFVTEMYDKLKVHISGYVIGQHITNTLKRAALTGGSDARPTPVAFVPYLDDENPYI